MAINKSYRDKKSEEIPDVIRGHHRNKSRPILLKIRYLWPLEKEGTLYRETRWEKRRYRTREEAEAALLGFMRKNDQLCHNYEIHRVLEYNIEGKEND